MAKYRGRDGELAFGADFVAELKAWSIELTADVVQGAAMGDDWVTTADTASKWTGTATAFVDPDDPGQGGIAAGATGSFSAPLPYEAIMVSGGVVVTSVERTAEAGGFVEMAVTFEGVGRPFRMGF